MSRYFYTDTISNFIKENPAAILGHIVEKNQFDLNVQQKDAWISQTEILRIALQGLAGNIFFEFSIPRMGRRVDAILLISPVIFVIEFKIGERTFKIHDLDQVTDYSLDLVNFHEGSHSHAVVPVLVASEAPNLSPVGALKPVKDMLYEPLRSNANQLGDLIRNVLKTISGQDLISLAWEKSGYKPTPTIIEATLALYRGHSVSEITRNDAKDNLTYTSTTVSQIIQNTRKRSEKAICFVTGVPGAGKTLVGLDIATKYIDAKNDLYSVFLSGNWPLVEVLQEALARDKVSRIKEIGKRIRKSEVRSEVKAFIQNVHHFRDDGLEDEEKAPPEHVAIFDEAQRAWDLDWTRNFMKRRKGRSDFKWSEPEYLISCMDRHKDWAVVVCLVGGGQEINTGEAGIGEWVDALNRSFLHWKVYVSDKLSESEFGAAKTQEALSRRTAVTYIPALHLKTSMRSFRSEKISSFVKQLLDLAPQAALDLHTAFIKDYPLVITRDIMKAKSWLKHQANGSERYGIVASSKAARLRPFALDVRAKASPVHWFLNGKDDVRSSYFMEDVATEFDVQGLELDWACVAWDADFRYSGNTWETFEFTAARNKPLMHWTRVRKPQRKLYLKNAYRVLLTRARQGMVILVPEGVDSDDSRKPIYYDGTFEYLRSLGLECI